MVAPAPKVERPNRLSAEDWALAALDVIAEQGLAAVAVEPLARRLGVTKGSFYWHFPSREALLVAALERWEVMEQETVFGQLEASPYHDVVRERDGRIAVPGGPGLGVEPDLAVLERYRLGAPIVIEG